MFVGRNSIARLANAPKLAISKLRIFSCPFREGCEASAVFFFATVVFNQRTLYNADDFCETGDRKG